MHNAKAVMLSSQMLSGLHCFRCAAKHLSFTRAAQELNLTQGAVSQRIKKLEEQLGFTLFLRYNRRLQLTAEAEALLLRVNSSLSTLEQAIRDIRSSSLSGELVISAPPSLALSWLCQHLPSFQQAYPQIHLKIETHNRLIDFFSEQVDVAIYYGQGNYPNLHSQLLAYEQLIPVCSPDYAQQFNLLGQPHNLDHCTLLHDAFAWPEAGPYAEWSFWIQQQGMRLDTCSGYCFDMSELAVQSAMQGLGVALGRKTLIAEYLEQGRLITPFSHLEVVKAHQAYYLVSHKDRTQQPAVKAFSDWLGREMKKQEGK